MKQITQMKHADSGRVRSLIGLNESFVRANPDDVVGATLLFRMRPTESVEIVSSPVRPTRPGGRCVGRG